MLYLELFTLKWEILRISYDKAFFPLHYSFGYIDRNAKADIVPSAHFICSPKWLKVSGKSGQHGYLSYGVPSAHIPLGFRFPSFYLGEVSRSQITSQSIHMSGRRLKCNCLRLYLMYSVTELPHAALQDSICFPLASFTISSQGRCGALNENGPHRLVRSGAVWKLRGMAMLE